jgi:hypothetical protein
MKQQPRFLQKHKHPKTHLRLPDLDYSKTAVLNSLSSVDGQRGYGHAIDEFVDWYCSEPRLALNRTVVKGEPQGKPFQVTSLETPALMIPKNIDPVDFSLADGRLVLPLAQTSGNIWILDNVDQ